ncbi:hypothetical protein OKJ48_05795 [Streptomyces kunmingensis]|uniref:DUF6801 domain-containing protein n=1 Tax=Streptomyces kunmingensis TaxID=68225 RepID=A0ABU6C4W4_9ACTN|nr:DUF6801 domain-containing protein [Streptomyces kunmingensis]MEB3959763.1 hypothetical protein [Streptomyces kunmingensis]
MARVIPIASVALAAGLLSGPGSHADEGQAAVDIAYDCAIPAPAADKPADGQTAPEKTGQEAATGTKTPTAPATRRSAKAVHASVRIATGLPTTAGPGTPIDPGAVTVEAALPYADLAPLLPAGLTTVTSDATLGVQVQQGEQTADATWSALTGTATAPPSDGTLRLSHTGSAPTITVSEAEDVGLYAGQLTLSIMPLPGTAPGEDGGSATAPFSVTCTPTSKGAADRRLARISVPDGTDPDAPSSPSASGPSESAREGIAVEPGADAGQPTGETTCAPTVPPGDIDLSQIPDPLPGTVLGPLNQNPDAQIVCAYAVGLTTIRKPDGSMIINDPDKEPGLMNIRAAAQTQFGASGPYYFRIDSLGYLDLPDAESTLLTFGFVPVSAKVSFENGPISISTGSMGDDPNTAKSFAVVTFFQSLRVHDVKVNGTPLDVGSNCRTSERYRAVLRGDFESETGQYGSVFDGGILKGTVDIPSFSGCGSKGEDLDRLLTASLSGPGNRIIMNQAPTCIPGEFPYQCPPQIPRLPVVKTP